MSTSRASAAQPPGPPPQALWARPVMSSHTSSPRTNLETVGCVPVSAVTQRSPFLPQGGREGGKAVTSYQQQFTWSARWPEPWTINQPARVWRRRVTGGSQQSQTRQPRQNQLPHPPARTGTHNACVCRHRSAGRATWGSAPDNSDQSGGIQAPATLGGPPEQPAHWGCWSSKGCCLGQWKVLELARGGNCTSYR